MSEIVSLSSSSESGRGSGVQDHGPHVQDSSAPLVGMSLTLLKGFGIKISGHYQLSSYASGHVFQAVQFSLKVIYSLVWGEGATDNTYILGPHPDIAFP